jgi:hypothetical protein
VFSIERTAKNPYGTVPRIARMIVNKEFDASAAVSPVVGISPVVLTEFDGGGAVAPVLGISPARATPESTHARAIAKAKRLICLFLL